MTPPKVSIIIVSWNVRPLLAACLRSLATHLDLPSPDIEVVVVDNASVDGSADLVADAFPWVVLERRLDNLGFGRANNAALPYCHAPVLLLLNPDTEVSAGVVETMLGVLEARPEVGIVGCRLVNTDGSLQRWTAGGSPTLWRLLRHALLGATLRSGRPGAGLYLERDVEADMDVAWVSGACLAVRRAAVPEGIFDERFFMYGEDMELCHRIAARGWHIVYTPRASVLHHHGQSTRQSVVAQRAALRGPRAFIHARGTPPLLLWDAITTVGFLLRAVGWTVAALLGRQGAGERARTCWRYTRDAMQLIASPAPSLSPQPDDRAPSAVA